MSRRGLPLDLFIGARARVAAQQGVPLTVVRRGDPSSGTILVRITLLNGTSRVLVETRVEDAAVWMPATRTDPMVDTEADAYLSKQAATDPDVWIVEIEDKKGRNWLLPEEAER